MKQNIKKYFIGTLVFTSFLTLVGCADTPTADTQTTNQQEQLQAESNKEVGLPDIVNFQEKKLLKMIYELRDQNNVVNYAYLYNEFTGKLVYLGECVGYGIPYSTQYSNPQKVIDDPNYRNSDIISQAEPNGLFMPSSSAGTWVMLVDPATKTPHPIYVEPDVIVSPFKLTNLTQ